MSEDDFTSVVDTNLTGAFRVVKRASKGMLKARFGRIVLISSVVGLLGSAGQVNYSASKAGLVGMARSLTRELGARNITANVVAPGFIETDMTGELPEAQQAEYKKSIPARPLRVARRGREGRHLARRRRRRRTSRAPSSPSTADSAWGTRLQRRQPEPSAIDPHHVVRGVGRRRRREPRIRQEQAGSVRRDRGRHVEQRGGGQRLDERAACALGVQANDRDGVREVLHHVERAADHEEAVTIRERAPAEVDGRRHAGRRDRRGRGSRSPTG